jgi:uncharacterized membrane protein
LASPIVHENADSPKQRILSQEALIMTEHSKHTEAHIDSIVRQEEEALEKRSYSERLADRVGTLAGSVAFVSHAWLHQLRFICSILTRERRPW